MALRLDKFLIGFLIFTAFIVGGTSIIRSVNNDYQGILQQNMSDSRFSSTYNTTDEIINISTDIKNKILTNEIDETDTVSTMFSGAYGALRLIRASFGIVGAISQDIGMNLPIDPAFQGMIITAVVIMVLFAILFLVFRIGTSG
jgi:multisubunit Na+/H+ antiporter MnhC subunit